MLDSASRERPSRDGPGARLADTLDRLQVVDAGGQQPLQPTEVLDEPVDDGGRESWHPSEQAVATWADGEVEVVGCAGVAEGLGHEREVEQLDVGEGVEVGECPFDGARAASGGQVVADHELAVGVDPSDELDELQREQPTVRAELDDVSVDLARDPQHHLEALGDDGDVAHGDEVLDLEVGQRAGDLVEPHLVPLQGGQRLVGAREDRRGVLEHVASTGDVQGDDVHRLAHRDHRVPSLFGDPLSGAVAGAHLVGVDARVGHQVDSGAVDGGGVGPEDDGAVHLRQLAEPGGRELDVEGEPAAAERLDVLVVAEDEESAGASAQDALEAVAQLSAGGHGREGGKQLGVGVAAAALSLVATGTLSNSVG